MMRILARLVFVPMLAFLVVLTGFLYVVKVPVLVVTTVADLAAPLVLWLAEIADGGES